MWKICYYTMGKISFLWLIYNNLFLTFYGFWDGSLSKILDKLFKGLNKYVYIIIINKFKLISLIDKNEIDGNSFLITIIAFP